jgi:hypothetical protein
MGIKIDFAHQTFRWDNSASGMAAVHCVIVGFSHRAPSTNLPLWEYADSKMEPKKILAKNINAYLLDAPDILISPRKKPLQFGTPTMDFGSMPNDGGFLSDISEEEFYEIKKRDPIAGGYLKRIIGSRELIHDINRYCLWLVDAPISDLRNSPVIRERVAKVKKLREESKRTATNRLSVTPHLFGEIRQPKSTYIAIGRVSSENRQYFPIAMMDPSIITNDAVLLIPTNDYSIFAVLISNVATLWFKTVSGRLKSDIRISATISYNNFPFPNISEALGWNS